MAVEIKGSFLSGKKKWLSGMIGSGLVAIILPLLTKWLISQGIPPDEAATTARTIMVVVIVPILAAIFGETAVDRARAKNGPKEGGK